MTSFAMLTAAAVLLCSSVVTGQDLVCTGSCVQRWGKCAGEGIVPGTLRPCCDEADQCVEKSPEFSQCRPKSRPIPGGWTGETLTCTDPPECDPTVVSARLSGLSANLLTDNTALELDFIFGDYLDRDGCLMACQENEDCFAFDETVDGDCTLFGKNLFLPGANLVPFFDAEIFLTKCFLAEPLCDPATREARQVNPIIAPNNPSSFHQMDSDTDFRDFFVSPADYTLSAAINSCRLQRDRLGGCIGFAIEEGTGSSGNRVILLYPEQPGTTNYRGDLADNPLVYSIEACL